MIDLFTSVAVAIWLLGGACGFILKTVFITKYDKYETNKLEKRREKQDWKKDVRGSLADLRSLSRSFRSDHHPDVELWIEELDHFERELYRKSETCPSENDEISKKVGGLSGVCSANKNVLSDLYFEIHTPKEGKEKIPLEHEFETIKTEDGNGVYNDRLIRHMACFMAEKTEERIDEINELLDEE